MIESADTSGAPKESPEVAAARRRLGTTYQEIGSLPSESGTVVIPGDESPAMAELIDEIINAQFVDIIGVFPAQCANSLLRRNEALQPSTLPHVQYFTPSRDRVATYRQETILGTLVQRYFIGLTGLRNWLEPGPRPATRPSTLTIFEIDDFFVDCLIIARTADKVRAAQVLQLPTLLPKIADGQTQAWSQVLTSWLQPTQMDALSNYVERLKMCSAPLKPRQVRCASTSPSERMGDFRPIISRLAAYGTVEAKEIEPVSIVAICTETRNGPSVLLKRRSDNNSRDDFEKLSMISERIRVEDLSSLYAPRLNDVDTEDDLDRWWIEGGRPEQFELNELAFRNAAQRELFLTCGLDVQKDRLQFMGNCVLAREDESTHLGFYIFRLMLRRTTQIDELAWALQWNADLKCVPFADLYVEPTRSTLNRLLSRKEDWLIENVFA